MEVNPSKCQVIHITRSKNPIPTHYTVYSSQLHTGICIFSKTYGCRHLFSPMMGYAHKSHSYKGKQHFLRRNIKIHSESLKSFAYKVIVRPLEYCSTVPAVAGRTTSLRACRTRARVRRRPYGGFIAGTN